VLIWRTRLGYEIRSFGHSDRLRKYAGNLSVKSPLIAMTISGGLAGCGDYNVMASERLVLTQEGAALSHRCCT